MSSTMARFRLGSLRLSADHSVRSAALALSAVAILSAVGAEAFAERPGIGAVFSKDHPLIKHDIYQRPSVRPPAAAPSGISPVESGVGDLYPGAISSSQMNDLLTQPSVRQPSLGPTDWASSQVSPGSSIAYEGSDPTFNSLGGGQNSPFKQVSQRNGLAMREDGMLYSDGTTQPQNSGANTEKEVDPFSKGNWAHGAEDKKKKDDKPNNGCGPNGCPSPGGPCGPGGCPSPGGGGGRGGGLLSKLGGGGGALGGLAGLAGLAGQNQGSGSGGLGSTSGGTSALESEIAEKEERVAELERQAAAKEATKSAEATAQALALTPTVTPTVTPTATGSVTPGDNVTPQPTVAATASVVPTAGATVAATATVAPSQGSATQSSLFPPVKLNM